MKSLVHTLVYNLLFMTLWFRIFFVPRFHSQLSKYPFCKQNQTLQRHLSNYHHYGNDYAFELTASSFVANLFNSTLTTYVRAESRWWGVKAILFPYRTTQREARETWQSPGNKPNRPFNFGKWKESYETSQKHFKCFIRELENTKSTIVSLVLVSEYAVWILHEFLNF